MGNIQNWSYSYFLVCGRVTKGLINVTYARSLFNGFQNGPFNILRNDPSSFIFLNITKKSFFHSHEKFDVALNYSYHINLC